MIVDGRDVCAACGSDLDAEGNCPNGCTENDDYGVIEGAYWDERDLYLESLRTNECQKCFAKLENGRCLVGCFDDLIKQLRRSGTMPDCEECDQKDDCQCKTCDPHSICEACENPPECQET